ncbi:outer membrane receptor protein involved in Fe transport [Sphingomonas kaistensis]|uniref:Outer membrane receptor protein involved in Fe transport n=1 Tax=Sphingomonas kaistensis TaxID=298708 RepID=A0A7X6BGL3_9SPHN|nr:TonB-dependent receptor [Sphingomonas kaistensis]NJC05570.1 outer membrane receptor protein involved in Fe transport [Sphingomonas kaistensis]
MPILALPAEIVVTARALPDPAAERLLGVSRIDRDRLEDAGGLGVEQVLREAAGVILFRRSDARSGQPTSQGVTLRALGGNAASRALLVLDGVPQSDPFGGWINWPAYDPAALAAVRIVRGGGSVADGPGALAGTIHLTSAVGEGIAGSVEAGSRSALYGSARAGMALGPGSLLLSGYGGRGEGFVPVEASVRGPADRASPYAYGGGRVRWVGEVAAGLGLEAAVSGFDDRRERGLAFTDNRTRGADASLRLVGRGEWGWSALVYGQRREFESSFASTDRTRTTATRTALQYDVPGRAVGWSAELRPPVGKGTELRLGTDGRRMTGRSDEFGAYSAGQPTRDRSAGGKSAHAGLFAELTWQEGRFTLSGTARMDRWTISDGVLRDRSLVTGTVSEERVPSRRVWRPTARVAAGASVSERVALRTAAYLGWRLPTLNELFRPFRAGTDAVAANPLLTPERLRGAEVGADWRRGGASVSVTAFANRLLDPIANVTLGTGPGTFPAVGFVAAGGSYRQRRNLDRIDVTGLEAAGSWTRGEWTLGGSLSLADARVRATGAAAPLDGLRPAQTSSFGAGASVNWERGGRSAGVQLRHSGRAYEDDLNRLSLPAATTVDAAAAWSLSPRVAMTVRAENLFDARVIAGRTGDGITERATPRSLWLGLRLTR